MEDNNDINIIECSNGICKISLDINSEERGLHNVFSSIKSWICDDEKQSELSNETNNDEINEDDDEDDESFFISDNLINNVLEFKNIFMSFIKLSKLNSSDMSNSFLENIFDFIGDDNSPISMIFPEKKFSKFIVRSANKLMKLLSFDKMIPFSFSSMAIEFVMSIICTFLRNIEVNEGKELIHSFLEKPTLHVIHSILSKTTKLTKLNRKKDISSFRNFAVDNILIIYFILMRVTGKFNDEIPIITHLCNRNISNNYEGPSLMVSKFLEEFE